MRGVIWYSPFVGNGTKIEIYFEIDSHLPLTYMEFVKPEIFTFGKQFKCKREIQSEMDLYWNKNSLDLHAGHNQAEKKP